MVDSKNEILQMKIPAVIVGNDLNPLGIVRSLGAAGVPMIKLVSDAESYTARSRYGVTRCIESTEGAPLLSALSSIAVEFPQQPVLFVTEEKSVRTVSEYRDALLPHFRLRLPDHERLMALMHKQGFQALAESVGGAIPPVVQLRSEADFEGLGGLTYPCVLKPSAKNYAYGARFAKAYVVQSADEAIALYREIAPICADLVVQQWIEGNDDDIYFCLQYIGDNGPVISFSGRKLRSWPPAIGGTASCTAAWEYAEELAEMTASFFAATGFTGMGSMEYKRDRRDGRFYMIEPTVARTDFQEEVATLNGVNIPLAAYCYEMGLPLPSTTRPERDRAWREPLIDRWSKDQQPDRIPAGMERLRMVDAYFRLNDPMPWVQWIGERFSGRWQSIRSRLQR